MTIAALKPVLPNPRPHGLDAALEAARKRIEVSKPELAEARSRRDDLGAALRAEFPGAQVYVNGSVAHGDALTPLTDVDVGVIVPDPTGLYGPGKRGPGELKERAAAAIRTRLKDKYGELAVEVVGRKRSILVRFRDPVTPGQPDFTADVIVAIDNPTGAGLYIPRYDSWDRSHPQKHTELVLAAIDGTDVTYARLVRLLKHHNRRHGKPLCSWQIKALALQCILSPTPLLTGLLTFFQHAAASLAAGDTPDPAHVARPIKTNEPRTQVARRMRDVADRLANAIDLENAGYGLLACDELAKLFNDEDMLPRPDQNAVRAQEAQRRLDERATSTRRPTAPAVGAAPVLLPTRRPEPRPGHRPQVRSWAP
jgi:predicted nucleotidyltransferase